MVTVSDLLGWSRAVVIRRAIVLVVGIFCRCWSAEGEADWQRFMSLARQASRADPDEGEESAVDCDRSLRPSSSATTRRASAADAPFLRLVLLGLIAATIVTGGITATLAARLPPARRPLGGVGF